MSNPERDMRRRMQDEPYRLLDHLVRRQVPNVMAEYGLESSAIPLREQRKLKTEEGAYLAVQALAAIAVLNARLAFLALEIMDADQRNELLGAAPPFEEVVAKLERP